MRKLSVASDRPSATTAPGSRRAARTRGCCDQRCGSVTHRPAVLDARPRVIVMRHDSSPTIRPSRITRTRWQWKRTSGISSEIMMTATPSAASALDDLVDAVLGADVDADGRAVEDQHARAWSPSISASTTRCWLPPDSVFTALSGLGDLDREVPDPALRPRPRAPASGSGRARAASLSSTVTMMFERDRLLEHQAERQPVLRTHRRCPARWPRGW